jgi:hypothetical protein
MDAYAANPAEHVLHPGVITTLFPHLPHRRTLPYRAALALGVILLAGLGALGLNAVTMAVAAALVPGLLLMYVYEVEVFGGDAWHRIPVTALVSAILGGLCAWVLGTYVSQYAVLQLGGVLNTTGVLGALVIAVAAQLVMLVPALIQLASPSLTEDLDGFTLGLTSGACFSAGATLVSLWPLVGLGPDVLNSAQGAALALNRGVLLPLINGTLTGLIAASVTVRRGTPAPSVRRWVPGPLGAVGVAAAAQLSLAAVSLWWPDLIQSALAWLVAAAILLTWARVVLHHMLLGESVGISEGVQVPCTHCHRLVPRMAFCPNCGVATGATPKTGAGATGRA